MGVVGHDGKRLLAAALGGEADCRHLARWWTRPAGRSPRLSHERDHALLSGSRLVARERRGHGCRWRAETFIAEVESFLADVESGSPIAVELRV